MFRAPPHTQRRSGASSQSRLLGVACCLIEAEALEELARRSWPLLPCLGGQYHRRAKTLLYISILRKAPRRILGCMTQQSFKGQFVLHHNSLGSTYACAFVLCGFWSPDLGVLNRVQSDLGPGSSKDLPVVWEAL